MAAATLPESVSAVENYAASVTATNDAPRVAAERQAKQQEQLRLEGIDRLLRIAQHGLDAPVVFFSASDGEHHRTICERGTPTTWGPAEDAILNHEYCRSIAETKAAISAVDVHADRGPAAAMIKPSLGAFLGVPVLSIERDALGALCAVHHDAHDWSQSEKAFLHDLAATIQRELQLIDTTETLAEQIAADTLERDFEEWMSRVAAAANRAWTVAGVVDAIVDNARNAVGARLVSVGVADGETLRFVHGEGVAADIADEWAVAPINDQIPMTHAVRSAKPVILRNRDDFAEWPAFDEAVRNEPIESFIAVPLEDQHGRVHAVLGIGFEHRLERDTLSPSVRRLASLARQGLQRATTFQQERRHARLLESLVLPSRLPLVPHLDVRGRYLPPTVDQRVGGDLYDVVPVDEHTIAFMVADAAGHDVASSKASIRVRHALGVLSVESRSPGTTLGAVNHYLQQSSLSTLVTAVYGVLDLTTGDGMIANAGHPQPRVLRSNGTVERVGPSGQPLLGFTNVAYRTASFHLDVEDIIVLFTDGLIERRGENLTTGENALEALLANKASMSTSRLSAAILGSLPEDRDDDVALLLMRRIDGETRKNAESSWAAPAGRLNLKAAREHIRHWLGPDHERADDVLLVVTELLTNAREAAEANDEITLSAASWANTIEVAITNPGLPFSVTPTMPDSQQHRGRGLAIASALADIAVTSANGMTTVWATFRGPAIDDELPTIDSGQV